MSDIVGYTPGPWVANGNAIETAEGEYIASMSSPRGVPQREKDARLIASAPAMAEEIKRLRAENERLTKRVEWFTHAIHTCHDECDRPLCKTTRERDALRALNTELVEALTLILPMAKGYAVQNRVGSNQELCLNADALIARAEGR